MLLNGGQTQSTKECSVFEPVLIWIARDSEEARLCAQQYANYWE